MNIRVPVLTFVITVSVAVATTVSLSLLAQNTLAQSTQAETAPVSDALAHADLSAQHYAVLHSPGPRWDEQTQQQRQRVLQLHRQHYQGLRAQGVPLRGGIFVSTANAADLAAAVSAQPQVLGFMLTEATMRRADIEAHVFQDPSVSSGVLSAQVRALVEQFAPDG